MAVTVTKFNTTYAWDVANSITTASLVSVTIANPGMLSFWIKTNSATPPTIAVKEGNPIKAYEVAETTLAAGEYLWFAGTSDWVTVTYG